MISFYEEGPRVFADVMLDDWFKRTFEEYGDAKRLMQLFIEAMIRFARLCAAGEYAPDSREEEHQGGRRVL